VSHHMHQLANDDYLWKQLHFDMVNEAPYPVTSGDAMEISDEEEGDKPKSYKEKFIADYKKPLPAPLPLNIQQQQRRPMPLTRMPMPVMTRMYQPSRVQSRMQSRVAAPPTAYDHLLAQTLFQATKLSSMASRASNGRCYVQ